MEVILSKELYSKEALIKTIYLYNDQFIIIVNTDEKNFILKIETIKNYIFNKAEFFSKLQEQQLREVLNEQSGKLREIIYQKAFSLIE